VAALDCLTVAIGTAGETACPTLLYKPGTWAGCLFLDHDYGKWLAAVEKHALDGCEPFADKQI